MPSSRQLAAIMFTDIAGYTALMGSDEQKAFELLKVNRAIQKPVIEQFNGRWIKELGDGVMASFNTVSDAVNAAIKIQEDCNSAKKILGKEIVVTDKSIGLDTYPLQVKRAYGKPMMRPIIFWNVEDQSIMLGAPVEEGDKFRFSLPPDFEVIDTVIESTKTIKENELHDADAMIVFSCVGRLSQLGPMLPMELEGLAGTWDKPMAGFFSLGEFGKLDDTKPEFHGTTVSWVAFKEK